MRSGRGQTGGAASVPLGEGSPAPTSALIVHIADHRCALPLPVVEEVVPAARVEHLPGAPASVLGVLNLRGDVVPVIDGRSCVAADRAPLRPSDRFVVLAPPPGGGRRALRVDRADDIVLLDVQPAPVLPAPAETGRCVAGVAVRSDALLVVLDVDAFLSAAEAVALREALERHEDARALEPASP